MSNKKMSRNYFKQLKTLLNKSIAPLTKIRVSAIIVTDKGVFQGVNYEDAICSLSICAERSAIYGAIPYGMKKIYEIHLLANKNGLTMCGLCRQLAHNFGSDKTKVFSYNYQNGKRSETTLGSLLPNSPLIVK